MFQIAMFQTKCRLASRLFIGSLKIQCPPKADPSFGGKIEV